MIDKLKGKVKTLAKNPLVINYIWVFLGQNGGAIFSMLSLVLTLRIISTLEYGSLVIIQTYTNLLSNLFCLRTFNGVIKFVTSAEAEGDSLRAKKYINTAFLLDAIMGAVAFVCGFFLLQPITRLFGWEPETVRLTNYYIPLLLFMPVLNGAPVGLLRKLGYFKQVNIIHAVVFGLQTAVLLATWMLGVHSFIVVLLEYAATEMIECIVLVIYCLRVTYKNEQYRGFWKAGFTFEGEFMRHNVYYGLTSTFDEILGNVSTLLINKYVGTLATAYIKVITRICNVFQKVTKPINQVFYPELCEWVTQKQYKKAHRVSMKYLGIVCAAGAALVAVLFGTYDWWIVIFDAAMTTAKLQSLLYMVYTILGISLICMNQLMFAIDLARESLIIVAICDLLFLVVLVPCVQTYGIYGYLLLQIAQLFAVAGCKYFFISRRVHKLERQKA